MSSGATAIMDQSGIENSQNSTSACCNGKQSSSESDKNDCCTNCNSCCCQNETEEEEYDSSWVNVEFFEPRLRKYYRDPSLKVKSVEVKPASGKGDGYGGIMLRATVTYSTNESKEIQCPYIVKTIVWNELTARTQKTYSIMEKEMDMYKNVLPKIKDLLESIGEDGDIFPDTVSVDADLDVIIMEDLNVKKYVMKDRLKGLDREHLLLFLKRLAQIHAASAVLQEQEKDIFQNCPFGMFNRVTTAYYTFFTSFWDALCEEISRWFGYSYYANKLKALREHFVEYACRVYDNDENDFCVLTHGDMWINNVMFNYTPNNTPKDCVVYDYQYAYFGTPFIDLILFIHSSTSDSVRMNHDEYLQYYYNNLKNVLQKLRYKKNIPTLFEFRQQYSKKSFLKLTATFIMYPVMTNELGDLADIEALLLENERSKTFRDLAMKRPVFQETVKKLLPIFDQHGLLDLH